MWNIGRLQLDPRILQIRLLPDLLKSLSKDVLEFQGDYLFLLNFSFPRLAQKLKLKTAKINSLKWDEKKSLYV